MPQGRSRIELVNQTARSLAMPQRRVGVLATVGVFEWGPLHSVTTCIDYGDFYETFGGLLASYWSPQMVKDYFDTGGRRAMVVRTVHMTGANPTTAAKATHTFATAAGGTYSATNTLTVTGLYYGALGNRISIAIQDASNGEASKFDLLVYLDGVLVDGEWYKNLSMYDSDATYVEDVINSASTRSRYIRVTDLDVGSALYGIALDQRPENATATLLTGGDDGLTGLVTADYQGSASDRTGLHALTPASDGDLLIVPDDTSTTLQNAAIAYCATEKQGKMTFIPDPPASSDKDAIIVQAAALTASECRTAIPWPRIKIANPDTSIYGVSDDITVPPSGRYCGRISKNTQTEKTKQWTQPSNEIYGLLEGAVGIEMAEVLEPTVRDYVTDYLVNPIVAGTRDTDGNYGVWVDDCQLGKVTGNFVSVGEQVGVAALRKTFEAYMQRHRTQGNTENRRREIEAAFEAELLKWTAAEAFASTNASEAFYVNVDPEGLSLNNAVVRDAQQLRILVGLATARPARFVTIIFTRDNRAVESYIQQQMAD